MTPLSKNSVANGLKFLNLLGCFGTPQQAQKIYCSLAI